MLSTLIFAWQEETRSRGILIWILAFWDLLRHRFSSPTQNILFTESLLTYNRPTSEQRETTVKVQMKNLQLSCWVLWHDEDESGFRRQKKFKSVSNETYCSQAHHPPISLQTVHYISLKNSLASLSVCQRSNHQPWKSTKFDIHSYESSPIIYK